MNSLKLLTGRRRSPRRRPLQRQPRTSSFPSAHAASAFAFAVLASREVLAAGALLLPPATAVAYSRVYLGMHYPSDVLAGAAIGAAYGSAARSATRRLLARRASWSPRGGDGTIGSVAARLAATENVLGVLPLGTCVSLCSRVGRRI